MVDSLIGTFRIVEKIGDGGMGAVYRAVDTQLERDVALKFLRPELASEPDLVERFRAEAIVLARLNHPNIAALYGLHRQDNELFMAMEFVQGETLEVLIQRVGRLEPGRAVPLANMVLDALEYAHRRGVVHRDIKTSNLMVTPEGTVKVMDFGIARVLGTTRKTRLGHVVGTLGYMAPEQIKGLEVDGRTDVYALGLVLYEMLAGRLPFQADTDWELMQAQVQAPPPRLEGFTDVPSALERAVLTALAKSRDERFASASAFKAALVGAIGPDRAAAAADGAPHAPVPPTRLAVAPAVKPTRLAAERERQEPSDVRGAPSETRRGRAGAPDGTTAAAPGRVLARWRLYAASAAVIALIGSAVVLLPRVLSRSDAVPPTESDGATGTVVATPPSRTEEVPPPTVVRPPVEAVPSRDLPRTRLPETAAPSPEPTPARPSAPRPAPTKPAPATPEAAAPGATGSEQPAPAEATPPQPAPVPPAPDTTASPAAPTEASAAPAAAAPPATARASLRPERFENIKLLEQAGDKVREVDVVLELGPDALVVRGKAGGQAIKSVQYQSIASATFSQSKHPRWKEGAGAAVAFGVFATPVFFMKGTKHWLTVQSAEDFVVLRLDKNNYRLVLPAFETRSGKRIDVTVGDK